MQSETSALELRGIVDYLCRNDLGAFAHRAFFELEGEHLEHSAHFHLMCRLLTKMRAGDIRRGLICIPPRFLKTYLCSIAFTAWLLGNDPKAKIICASYGANLAEKFSSDVLKLMRTRWYRRIFPNTRLDPKKQSKVEIGTTAGGYRIATSVGGTVTGRGAQYIIIDDPLKADEAHSPTAREACHDWFKKAVVTRFNHPRKGRILMVAQRLHLDDLPGNLIETGKYEQLILPAIHPKTETFDIVEGGKKAAFAPDRVLLPTRLDLEDLEELRKQMGDQDYNAQYLQNPLPLGGGVFREAWIKRYTDPPSAAKVEAVIQSWDTAYEGDETQSWSVCTTWAKCPDGYYLLDVWRDRPNFPALHNKVLALKAKWNAKMVIVEKKASGISLIETIHDQQQQQWLVHLSPSTGKVERAQQQAVKFEQGRIWLPEEAEWLAAYEAELFRFPQTKFDDQVDSTVQLLAASDQAKFHNMLNHAL